jgi:hypothetical protein
MREKKLIILNCILLSFAVMAALIPPCLHADEQQSNKTNEAITGNNTLIIDLSLGISSSLKLEPQKQYLIYLKGVTIDTSRGERVVLIGRYYDYKTGKYSNSFVLNDLKKGDDVPVFTLYTERESYGYYSIRFVKVKEGYEKDFRDLLREIDREGRDPSAVFATCFAGMRLYLEGAKPPEIVQFDYGWSMLFNFNEGKIDGPHHFFVLNAYPGAWLMSYKDAAKREFLSKLSISFGLGLSNDEEESKNWFLGATIPVAYDFGIVLGIILTTGDSENTKFTLGIKIGPELLLKAIEAMKLKKPPDF